MRFIRLLILALVWLPASAHAEQQAYYVAPSQLPPKLLPAPPAEGSPLWNKQIEAVISSQQSIGDKDMAALRNEQHLRLELMTGVVDADFSREKFPIAYTMLEHAQADTGAIVEADKQYWHTRRPYLADPRVKLLVDPIDQSPAYPSGHTCGSRVVAEVLAMLYPGKVDALRRQSEAIAHHRVQAGVHYPADLEAGKLLATLIVGLLIKNAAFKADLAAAQDEINGSRANSTTSH